MIAQLTFPSDAPAAMGGLVDYNPYAVNALTKTWLYEPLMVRTATAVRSRRGWPPTSRGVLLSARLLADEILVMSGGKVGERGSALGVIRNPADPYTRTLLNAIPNPFERTAHPG
jgi:hypothetical protein